MAANQGPSPAIAEDKVLGSSEDRIHEATEDRSYQAPPGRIHEAVEEAAALAEETGGLGSPGRPLNRRSPFYIGIAATAGVAVTFGLVELLIKARSVLVLIGLALFIAAGLDPAVSWLQRHGLRRWQAVLVTLAVLVAAVGGFLAAAIPPLAALTVSIPVAALTLGFYIAYRLSEDYFLVPRIMGKTVQVPGAVSVVAVLVGGTLMGIVGALVAIPAAAALRLLLEEVAFHRLDAS
jgi:predicted PurR-regulated permease PerM